LALALDRLPEAFEFCTKIDSEERWRQVGDIALAKGNYELAGLIKRL